FHHAPIDALTPFNKHQDDLHSLFATTTGISFILLAVSTAFLQTGRMHMILALSIAILACLFSILIFRFPQLAGIWQRSLFVLSFGWLLYEWSRKAL
ncbi:MAG: hypothetical protein KDC55_13090, partial [Ignavibacteriae bacterium]|nr:hypothetical protein [Ignavibacteriota bacterium]